MDNQQAVSLIKSTFEQQFDKDKYARFTRELLNGYEDAPFTLKGVNVRQSFSEQVDSFERLGKYKDADNKRLDILIVHLKKDHSVGHARTMQRNFVAGYLKGDYGRTSSKDAALVAFVSPNSADWRFSLVKMDTVFDKSSGRPKPVDEFTPARRWSFLVGVNERSHTAQSRLVPILAEDEKNPTLGKLEEAFNIESVTKEFFTKYRNLFLDTKEALDKTVKNDPAIEKDFEGKGVNTVDFAKKLLGQIVFLYFLQKKGWFGVPKNGAWGCGSKQFLRELFEKKHGSYTNFFNDILEPLFYEALRLDRSHEDHYYSQFKCKIPFLNGGLFDPIFNYDWSKTDILLPDDLFSNNHRTPEGDAGDGILDIFDRYNFTVKEDEPLDKEVAIDPELLGKAYEKFNAIRPDNFSEYKKALKTGEEGKFNKQFGVYYTPREIVHYMCQQSLINYLFTGLNSEPACYEIMGEKNLNLLGNQGKRGQLDITVEHKANPEISKGDIETLILHGEGIKEHEDHINEKGGASRAYPHKMPQTIRDNAKRIDDLLAGIKVCDPAVGSGAFPVGMMSEIVKIRSVLDKRKKSAAYDYKRQCIENSLYGVDIDSGAVEIAKLRLWLSLVVDEMDIENIKPLPNLDYKIVRGDSLKGYGYQHRNLDMVEELKNKYINATAPQEKSKLKKDIDKIITNIYLSSIKLLGYKVDFDYQLSFSEVFRVSGGFDVVVANPPYDVYQGDKKDEIAAFKKYRIYDKACGGKLNAYKLFLAKSLELLKKNGFLCEIFQNSFLADISATKLRKHFLENMNIVKIDSFPERDNIKLRVFEDAKMSVCIIQCFKIKQIRYEFVLNVWDSKYMQNGKKVTLNNQDIISFDPFNYTIPSINQYEYKVLKKIAETERLIQYAKCYEGEINLTFHKKYLRSNESANNYKMVKGAAIQKWFIKEEMSQGEVEYLNMNSYLKNNHGPKSMHYKNKRIVMQGITGVDEKNRLKMTMVGPQVFCGNSTNYVLVNNKNIKDKYLLALLNSKLINWYFKIFSTNSNVNAYEVEGLPILLKTNETQNLFIELVDKIMAIANTSDYLQNKQKQDKIEEYQNQINIMVYKLYGLTHVEVKIVDPGFALSEKEYNAFKI
ncbi:MAG: TaqI-like C-terminal specificity domain-containing protein [Candidatus Edwardsbacteria bacterium]|nr:TaqI-like C-terminal specificity domain-containing protein [Candidatus Edwardsbacteria bacterium]